LSHDRGCLCGKESYEYSDCTETICNKRPKLENTESILAKSKKYDSAWADAAERAEWAFVATALREAEKLMSHRISWISVATGIATDRSKSGWRDYDKN